jgi:hypothetical protein
MHPAHQGFLVHGIGLHVGQICIWFHPMSEEVESNHPAEYQDPPIEEPLLQRTCAGAQIRVGHTYPLLYFVLLTCVVLHFRFNEMEWFELTGSASLFYSFCSCIS